MTGPPTPVDGAGPADGGYGALHDGAGARVMARAAVTAASRAAALCWHSSSSVAGSLSATMPAPACTWARPSGETTMVRMAMAVSMLPEKSM